MTEQINEENIGTKTNEEINRLHEVYEKKLKFHRRVRIGLGIAAGVLLALGIVTVFPWGMAAFGPAWWAVNGSLTSLGILGVGSVIVSKLVDRKNVKALNILKHEKALREGNQDLRTQEKTQQKLANSYNKGEKYLPEDVKEILQKPNPEVSQNRSSQGGSQGSQGSQGPEQTR